MTEEAAIWSGIEDLASAIIAFTEQYCEEHEINDANVILHSLGVSIACFIDGTVEPKERVACAKKVAEVLVRCVKEEMEIRH